MIHKCYRYAITMQHLEFISTSMKQSVGFGPTGLLLKLCLSYKNYSVSHVLKNLSLFAFDIVRFEYF